MTNIDTQIIFDKNGNPIPQYLDVTDKTGGSAGTMKPITGQNGAQFTQLTGSNVEKRKVIKSHTVAHDLIGNYLFVGEDIAAGSTSVTFLDVSMYESIAVIIKNNLDVAVEGVYGALNTAAKRSSSDFREEYKIGDAIPSGATVFFSAEDVQGTTFSPYMYLQILVSNPTQGSLDIAFVGGR